MSVRFAIFGLALAGPAIADVPPPPVIMASDAPAPAEREVLSWEAGPVACAQGTAVSPVEASLP
jgi:hypothetical protein